MSKRTFTYLTLTVIMVALSLRLIGLNKGIHVDEAWAIERSSNGGIVDVLVNLQDDVHPPVYYLFMHYWVQLGDGEIFLRLPSAIMGTCAVLVMMLCIRRYSAAAGVLAGVLLAAAPLLLFYSQEIRDYALLTLGSAFTFLFASSIQVAPEKSSGYIGLALALTLTIAGHLIGIFLILPVCAFLLGVHGGLKKIHILRLFQALAVPVVIFLFLQFFYLAREVNPLYQGTHQSRAWWGPPISRWMISYTITNLFGLKLFPWPWDFTKQIGLFAVPCFVIMLAFGNWRHSLPFLVATVMYWLEIVGYSLTTNSLFYDRFLLPSLIPLSGFVSLQVVSINRKTMRIASIVMCAVVSGAFATHWVAHAAWIPKEPWKVVAQQLKSQDLRNDLLIFYPDYTVRPVGYYLASQEIPPLLAVKPGSPRMEIAREITDRLNSIRSHGSLSNVFLMVRYDAAASNDAETLQEVLSLLMERIDGDVQLRLFSVSMGPPTDNLLATIASVLGHPTRVDDLREMWTNVPNTFVSAQYLLHQTRILP